MKISSMERANLPNQSYKIESSNFMINVKHIPFYGIFV
jgi:hypothetical protein